MAHPQQLDCSSIGMRQGVASYSGNAEACTCSLHAVSLLILLIGISGLDVKSNTDMVLATALDDKLV